MPRAPKYRVEATWQCFKESHDSMFGLSHRTSQPKTWTTSFSSTNQVQNLVYGGIFVISRWSFFDWFLWCQVCYLDIYCQIRLSLRTVWTASMCLAQTWTDLMVQGRRSHIPKKDCVSSQAAEKTFRFYRWVWDVGRMAVRTRLSRSCAGSTGRAIDTWWDDVRCAHQKGGYFMIFQRRSLCWWNLWVTWLHLDAFCMLNIEKTWAVTFWSNHVQCYFFI